MASTLLSTLINRMNRWQSVQQIEEQYKVRDLDDAIRNLKRAYCLPFFQKKTSLKLFDEVYEYAPASDHDYLLYLERQAEDLRFGDKFRARYTSLRQFYEDPDNRNQVAEIWNNGTLTLGVRDKTNVNWTGTSQELDDADAITGYTASGDASGIVLNTVNYKEGIASVQFTVTSSTGSAVIEKTLTTSFTDSDYLKKYFFVWVYLAAAPTSITLKYGADSSNYLYSTVTTCFDGSALQANQWNRLAFDLSAATTTGTITTSTSWAWFSVTLTGATSGTYNIDASYVRAWSLLDYWYISKYAVALTGSSVANQEYFYNTAEVYATSSSLVGDTEWADVVMYTALVSSLTDKENQLVLNEIKEKRDRAWQSLEEKWPSMKPQLTTTKYRFGSGDEFYGYFSGGGNFPGF